MHAIRVCARLVGGVVIVCWGSVAAAQSAREGSGTSWLPDSSPMYAVHVQRGAWMLMAHENAFLQFLHESGRRGDDDAGSINWFMGMAQRNAGRGHLGLRGMLSLEPWTIRGCGYPDLLASGEQCHGDAIHDRQHPHDFAMEIAAEYDAPLTGTTRWQVYGGPSAEPALGPVAYPHRVSAMPNPIAPIAHHWLDATHVSFGVVTGGVYGQRWKLETSAFNGREPDENRKDFDFGALDSVSGTRVVSANHECRAAGVRRTSERRGSRRRNRPESGREQDHRVGDVSSTVCEERLRIDDRVGTQLGIRSRDQRASARDECDARRSAHVVRPAEKSCRRRPTISTST